MKRKLVWLLLLAGLCALPKLLEPKAPVASAEMSRTPGVRLIFRYECGKCHQIQALPGINGKMGPSLDGLSTRAPHRVVGLKGEQYIRQSLCEPQAYTVEGYLKTMPSYAQLPPQELDELVVYLNGL
jgi:cytochrome c553